MKSNQQIMQHARNQLTGNWEVPIVSYLVAGLISGVGGPISLVVAGPMQFGASLISLNLSRGKKAEFEQIFAGFKSQLVESIGAYLLAAIYILLWSMLFVVPGIIAAIAYSQLFFILVDNDKITATDAISQSKKMMQGHKWTFFCLGLRFIGWFILAMLTFGIGFLWLIPYMQVSYAKFYDEVK